MAEAGSSVCSHQNGKDVAFVNARDPCLGRSLDISSGMPWAHQHCAAVTILALLWDGHNDNPPAIPLGTSVPPHQVLVWGRSPAAPHTRGARLCLTVGAAPSNRATRLRRHC